jgi:hypothetical protein
VRQRAVQRVCIEGSCKNDDENGKDPELAALTTEVSLLTLPFKKKTSRRVHRVRRTKGTQREHLKRRFFFFPPLPMRPFSLYPFPSRSLQPIFPVHHSAFSIQYFPESRQ